MASPHIQYLVHNEDLLTNLIRTRATTIMMTIHMATKGLRFVKRLITKPASELSLFPRTYFLFCLCVHQMQTNKQIMDLLVDAQL